MEVPKRQREKSKKIEQRKVREPEWEPQVKQIALLANPIYIGQAQRRKTNQPTNKYIYICLRSQNWALASLHFFWVGAPSHLEDTYSFTCQIKLSCNTDPSITSNFCCGKTELRKSQTPPTLLTYLNTLLGIWCNSWQVISSGPGLCSQHWVPIVSDTAKWLRSYKSHINF